MDKVTMRS